MRRTSQYGTENYKLMSKMKAWADVRGLLTNDSVLFGIALDNPQFTKSNECRYDVCLLFREE
jgi:DNA gyrase inhibitor GyrI